MAGPAEYLIPAASEVGAHEMEELIDRVLRVRYPDIDSDSLRLSTNLKRALTVLGHRELEQVYDRFGVPEAGSRTLSMLWIFGEMSTRDICKLAGVSRQAVAGVVNTLEKRGLVVRNRATTRDRRQHTVRITDDGIGVIGPILEAQNRVHSQFFSALTATESETLMALLTKLVRTQSM